MNKGEWEVKIVAENGRTVTTGRSNPVFTKATFERPRERAYTRWSPGSESEGNVAALQSIA